MDAKLTPEFARGVELPSLFTPYKRHEAVEAILDDPSMVGEGIGIEFHPGRQIDILQDGRQRGWTGTFAPLLGRNALKNVAEHIQYY
jgi:hypothetical protein